MRRALLLAAALAAPCVRADPATSAIVTLGDGTAVPLSPWTFSYEYVAYAKGTSPALASFSRRESQTLWAGKRALDTAGAVLEIGYETLERTLEVQGEAKRDKLLLARELRLLARDGKKSAFKVEPPNRDALFPGATGDTIVSPRSLDLQGQTLGGTKTSYCIASYTSLVECGGDPAHQVTRVEFR